MHRELRGGGPKSPVDVIFVYDSHTYDLHHMQFHGTIKLALYPDTWAILIPELKDKNVFNHFSSIALISMNSSNGPKFDSKLATHHDMVWGYDTPRKQI